jgi:hypothetical protein
MSLRWFLLSTLVFFACDSNYAMANVASTTGAALAALKTPLLTHDPVELESEFSFLDLETQTQKTGAMKFFFEGIIGGLLFSYILVSLAYWMYTECRKYPQLNGCFGFHDRVKKYQIFYEIFLKVAYELDPNWPPRKNWLQSFIEGLPKVS